MTRSHEEGSVLVGIQGAAPFGNSNAETKQEVVAEVGGVLGALSALLLGWVLGTEDHSPCENLLHYGGHVSS